MAGRRSFRLRVLSLDPGHVHTQYVYLWLSFGLRTVTYLRDVHSRAGVVESGTNSRSPRSKSRFAAAADRLSVFLILQWVYT